MALTGASAAGSSLYKRQTATNSSHDMLDPQDLGAKARSLRITHTIASGEGDGTVIGNNDEMNLAVIPGASLIDLKRTHFTCSADLGDAADLSIGYRAYKKPDGTTVAEDANGVCVFADLGNSSTTKRHYYGTGEASITHGNGADALGVVKFNSREPVTLFMKARNSGGTFDGDAGDILYFQFGFEQS